LGDKFPTSGVEFNFVGDKGSWKAYGPKNGIVQNMLTKMRPGRRRVDNGEKDNGGVMKPDTGVNDFL
jgi:hypothetical protein